MIQSSEHSGQDGDEHGDRAPGDEKNRSVRSEIIGYCVGLVLAVGMTVTSFYLASGQNHWVWAPSIPVALAVLAIAQIGVHLVFFLHTTTGPDNVNNVMALAFGTLIVILLIGGSLWIMTHLHHNVMPMEHVISMQR